MKRKVLASLLLIAVVAGLVGTGTFAWFSDTVNSNDNTFTTGTLDLEISNDGTNWYDPTVTGTWVSPANWAPGEQFTATVRIKNVGNIDVKYLGIDWHRPSGWEALATKIEVVGFRENIPGYGWIDDLADPQHYQLLVKDYASPLTLLELAQSYHGAEPGTGAKADEWGGWVNYTTDAITGSGYDITPGPAIIAGGTYEMEMTFKLSETTGNEFQGKSMSMNITFTGAQDMSVFP